MGVSAERSQQKRDLATETLFRRFGAVAHASRIHAVTNRAVSRLLEWVIGDLNTLTATRGECRLEVDGAFPFFNNVPVRASRELRGQLSDFSDLLRANQSGGFRMRGPATRANLSVFFDLVRTSSGDRASLQKQLEERGANAIELLPPRKLMAGALTGSGSSVRVAASDALRGYVRAVAALESSRQAGNLERLPAPIYRAVQELADLAVEEPEHHLALTNLREEIGGESRHPIHVAVLSMALGARLGLSRALLVEIGFSALLIGELCSGASDERRVEVTARMVHVPKMTPVRARRMLVIYEHALPRPQGLHLFSRIVAIAIAYDRLTTRTEEHSAVMPDEALALLEKDSRLDADLVRIFGVVIGRYPLGAPVRLSSGELAVVYHTPADPSKADRPVVRIIRDREGRPMNRVVDLSVDSRQIVGLMDRELAGLEDSLDFFR